MTPAAAKKHSASSGMTLVEMTVSILLIGAISLALGAAMFHSRHREQRIRQTLTLAARQNNILRYIQQDIRWASQINLLQSNCISIVTSPNDSDVTPIPVMYLWYSPNKELQMQRDGKISVLASNIYSAEFDAKTFNDNGTDRLRGVQITLQFGPDSSQTVSRFIETINTPEWGG